MVFSTKHDCGNNDCRRLAAYVKIYDKLTKIGHFGIECKQFEPLDLQKEAETRLAKTRQLQMDSEIRQTKRENREQLDMMKNQFVRPSFIQQNDDDSCHHNRQGVYSLWKKWE